jgi:hypothetical protein
MGGPPVDRSRDLVLNTVPGMPHVTPGFVVEVIDGWFPQAKGEQEDFERTGRVPQTYGLAWGLNHAMLASLVNLLDEVPAELLTMKATDYGLYGMGKSEIRNVLDLWRNDHGMRVNKTLTPVPNHPVQLNPVTLVRMGLSKCPEAVPSEKAPKLTFVADDDLRSALELDLSSAEHTYQTGQWKGSTVLAASVVEALLLWRLAQVDPAERRRAANEVKAAEEAANRSFNTPNDIHDWGLHQCIEVAERLGIIAPEIAAEARRAKDYRNLIHGGAEIRKRARCDRHTATVALAAAYGIVKALGGTI